MDSLNYEYNRDINGRLINNQLVRVRDNVNSAEYIEDIDDQPVNNYSYDAIGNLVRDSAEGISRISWTVYGKIHQINKRDGTVIRYRYDAGGNRIGKSVAKPSGAVGYTWYVRDASGNVMSTYETSGTGSELPTSLYQREVHLYGSSRIGIFNRRVDVKENYAAPSVFSSYRGQKFFELSNHLGNVLATISDRKVGFSTNGTDIDYYEADVVTASDYYPFGMLMPGRQFGQGLNIAGGEFTETTEVNGYQVPVDLVLNTRSGSEPVEYVASGSIELVGEFESGTTDEFEAYIADESYAGTGNIGGATGTAGLYRYGFNGKENDDEVKGTGNQQDYGMRIYDPRISKFLSVDPLTIVYPWYTPYQFAGNKPIWKIDLDGKEEATPEHTAMQAAYLTVSTIYDVRNSTTNTLLRITPGLNSAATEKLLQEAGLNDQDLVKELATYFNARMRTVITHTYEDINGNTFEFHERKWILEPKNSIGKEIIEGALDLASIASIVTPLKGAPFLFAKGQGAIAVSQLKFLLHPKAFLKGFQVPLKANGAPDFKSFLAPVRKGQLNELVDFEYTGSYGKDFRKADELAGFTKDNPRPANTTWHHVEDYNSKTGKGTLQLVESDVHRAANHSGGVSQYRTIHGSGY